MRGWKKTISVDADNPVERDMYLEGGNSVVLTNEDNAEEATAQEIGSRLLLVRGSYFLDLSEGLPLFQEILIKGFVPGRVREVIRQAIASHPAVVDVPVLTLDVDRTTRAAQPRFEARTNEGKIVRSEDFGPVRVR